MTINSTQDLDVWFDHLFQSYSAAVTGYFTMCFGADNGEDLTQQTFLKLWIYQLAHPGFCPKSWKAWVFRAAVNVKNDYYRWSKHLPQSFEFLEEADSPAIVLENTNVDKLAVQAAFGQLKVRDREILALKNMGFSSQEMGSLLKISDSAARSRLAGAKSRFASLLQNHGIQV